MGKKIVIIGAGYTGTLVAKNMARKFPDKRSASITLIDRNSFHTMMTELHEVAAGRVHESSIRIELAAIFKKDNVNLVQDEVESIDFKEKVVKSKNGSYDYDILVIATGSKPTYYGTKGAKEYSFSLWSYEDAIALREHIEEQFKLARKEKDKEKRKAILTFVVAGAGLTGVEMTGELAEWVPSLCSKHGILQRDVQIIESDLLERVVPTLPAELSAKIKARLTEMGVQVLLKTKVVEIGPDSITIENGDKTEKIFTKTVIWTAGIEGSELVEEKAKELPIAGRLRIEANEFLQAKGMKNIYVGGDNLFRIYDGMPVLQCVENAEQSAEVIAHNISIDLGRVGNYKRYQPEFHGIMVCVGGRYGAAHVGLPYMKFKLPSLPAMGAKHFMNLVYLTQVAGTRRAAEYLMHEFVAVPERRNFLYPRLNQPWNNR